MDPAADLSARALLRHIQNMEPPKTPFSSSADQAQSGSPPQHGMLLRGSKMRRDSESQSPQSIVRRSLRHKIHQSITQKSLPAAKQQTPSVMLRKLPVSSPRQLLKLIQETGPVMSPLVHESAPPTEPQPPSADRNLPSLQSSVELSGLDLSDPSMGDVSIPKGLSRKRPRRSLNVTAFEKLLKDAARKPESSAGENPSLSTLSSATSGLQSTFDVDTEKIDIQRKVPHSRRTPGRSFNDATSKQQIAGPVMSPLVHESAPPTEPQPPSADRNLPSLQSSVELSGLDLSDPSMGDVSIPKGLSRKRPRRSLNVTAFEKLLKDAARKPESSAGENPSLSTLSSATSGLQSTFDVDTEKIDIQRKVPHSRRTPGRSFNDATSKQQIADVPNTDEDAKFEGITLSLSELSDSDVEVDIKNCHTTLYDPHAAVASSLRPPRLRAKPQQGPFSSRETRRERRRSAVRRGRNLWRFSLGRTRAADPGKDEGVPASHRQDDVSKTESEDTAASCQPSSDRDSAVSSESSRRENADGFLTFELGVRDKSEEEEATEKPPSEEEEAVVEPRAEDEGMDPSQTEEEAGADPSSEEEEATEEPQAEDEGMDPSQTEEEAGADPSSEEEEATEEPQAEDEGMDPSQTEEEEATEEPPSEEEEATEEPPSEEEEATEEPPSEEEEATEKPHAEDEGMDPSQTEEEEATEEPPSEEEEATEKPHAEDEGMDPSQTEEEAGADPSSEEEEVAVESQAEDEGMVPSQTEEEEATEEPHAEDEGMDPSQTEEEEVTEEPPSEEEEATEEPPSEEEEAVVEPRAEDEGMDPSQTEEEGGRRHAQPEDEGESVSQDEDVVVQKSKCDVEEPQAEEDEASGLQTNDEVPQEEEEEEEEELERDTRTVGHRAYRSEGRLVTEARDDPSDAAAGSSDCGSDSLDTLDLNTTLEVSLSEIGPDEPEPSPRRSLENEPKGRQSSPSHLDQVSHDAEACERRSEGGDAAAAPAEQEQDWADDEEEEDTDYEELPDNTPAFVKQKRIFTASNPRPLTFDIGNVQARSSSKASPKAKQKRVRRKTTETVLPKTYLMSVFKHFAKTKVSADVLPALNDVMDEFLKYLSLDLEAYAAHANRKTITVDDVMLLLRRQGYINDKMPVEVLIEKYLRMEQRKILIPIAASGNVVIPKIKK